MPVCSGRVRAKCPSQVLDFLQNKDGKALVLTSRSAIYLDLARQRARWAVPLAALIGVSSSGLPDANTLDDKDLRGLCVMDACHGHR